MSKIQQNPNGGISDLTNQMRSSLKMKEAPERILVLFIIGVFVVAIINYLKASLTVKEFAFYTLFFYNVVVPTISWEKIRIAVKKIVD